MIKHLVILALASIPFMSAGQTAGCKDPAAANYDPGVTINNGTCVYPNLTVTPALTCNLGGTLVENSGMVFWNDKLWTHNDGGGAAAVYELDTTGSITRTIVVSNATNVDWEDIAQDDLYIYVGDFGNNSTGNRTDLKIYRLAKSEILASNSVVADIIRFSYPEQVLGPATSNSTDFDCEAMIAKNGKIYLFTKQWTSQGTALYEFPATPGSYSASLLGTLNVGGLITGADIEVDNNIIVLTGYNAPFLNRFIYLLYDFTGNAFFAANKRKVAVGGSRQTEAVAFRNPEFIYISNENSFFGPQRVESINLTTILHPYISLLPISTISLQARPVSGAVQLTWDIQPASEFREGDIQRKYRSGDPYVTITRIQSAQGTYQDKPNVAGESIYYRVKAVDKQWAETYGMDQIIRLQGLNRASIKFTSPQIHVSLPPGSDPFQIRVIDMTGSLKEKINTLQRQVSINTSQYPKGIYVVNVERNNLLEDQYRFYKN